MTTVGEIIVEGILWWQAGRHSQPPAVIAAMTSAERDALWQHVERLVARKGETYAMSVAETIADTLRETP